MDKNNYNNNEMDFEMDFEIDMDILQCYLFYKGGQKTQLLEMSILPVFRIS